MRPKVFKSVQSVKKRPKVAKSVQHMQSCLKESELSKVPKRVQICVMCLKVLRVVENTKKGPK